MKNYLIVLLLLFVGFAAKSQDCYWQQKVEYQINVDVDAKDFKYTGGLKLKYFNNSPDTLKKVYFHLYMNAFQPGSEMDVRQGNLSDPDNRIGKRIRSLRQDEIGFQKILRATQNEKEVKYKIEGTLMEVWLKEPLAPNSSTDFYLSFSAQLPIQIRRNGRNNSEGVALSMAQWYPKMAEYDSRGWHIDPYIAREFYGVYGDFDVKINIDSKYTVGGTGVLQNAKDIGHGYSSVTKNAITPIKKLVWHFKANNVHDFAWSADPEFKHEKVKLKNGKVIHFIYKKGSPERDKFWVDVKRLFVKGFVFMEENFGEYPYEQFTVIQGGDGGMEYPMCTFILADGKDLEGKLALLIHETLHSWYYGVIGTNEQDYAWMDEGFTTWAEELTMDYLFPKDEFAHKTSYDSYKYLVRSGREQPMSTKADFYATNMGYGISSYYKGSIFLVQLGYIIGDKKLRQLMLKYYDRWKFKHPTPNDFKKMAEEISGIQLDWYFNKWIHSIDYVDYSFGDIIEKGNQTVVFLKRRGQMPMPLDIEIKYKNGKINRLYIPLRMMRGQKANENYGERQVIGTWPWVYEEISFTIESSASELEYIEIDPSLRMADINRLNNKHEF